MSNLVKTPVSRAVAHAERPMVDAAVAHIRGVWTQGLLATVVAVGDYLIEHFYDGSLELARSRSPSKASAFAQLLGRVNELPIGVHQLRQAIRVSVQYRELPAAIADRLSASHHGALLLVEDARVRGELAAQVVQGDLSVRELERMVRKLKPRHPGGRPAAAPPLRWARALVRAVNPEGIEALAGAPLRRLSPADLDSLEASARLARKAIDRVLEACTQKRRGK